MNTVDIRGEHIIEQLGGVEKGFKVNRIFLAPEHRGDLLRTAPFDDPLQFRARMAHLVAPKFILSSPGRLDEQQVGIGDLEFSPPVIRGQLMQDGFWLIRTERELIHDAGDVELALDPRGNLGRRGEGHDRLRQDCVPIRWWLLRQGLN